MRSTPSATKSTPQATGEGQPAEPATVLSEMLDRITAEQAVCETLGDPELAQRATRNVLTAIACAADAVLADAETLHAAPDKVAAFFDKSATACVAAIDGLHKRTVLMDGAADAVAPGRPGAAAPQLNPHLVWGPAPVRAGEREPAARAPRE